MEILKFFEGFRTDFFTSLFSLFTFFGEEYVFLILSLSILWCVNKNYGYCLLFAGIVGQNINQFLKYTCEVPRPWVAYPELNPVLSAIENAGGYSFPSGHTQIAATTYGTLAYFYRKKKALCTLLIATILAVGISRMYLGVHYFSDVAFSLLLGLIIVVFSCKAFEREVNNNIFRVITVVMCSLLLLYTLLTVNDIGANSNELFALEFSSKFFGAGIAFIISWYLDEKYIRYTTEGKIGFQLFKLLVGAAIVIILRFALKKFFMVIGINQTFGDALRYFALVIFAGCFWPMLFNKL